jgi:hypothetical protein
VHNGLSINPTVGTAQNFSSPVTYIVTAEDGSTQQYVVTVNINKSSDKSITLFRLDNLNVTGAIVGNNITVNVPFGTNVTSLIPTVYHTGYSISPNTGVSQNFNSPVLYTVTAQDGTTQSYTVTVAVADATVATPIFSVPGGSYTNDQTITITCTTDGASIHYTTNGDEPTAGSTPYTEPVVLSGSGYKTLRAIAVKDGMLASGIKTENYYIQALSISYAGTPFTFTNGTAIPTEILPTASKTVTTYSITPSLPNGMTFNTTTGGIGGTPNTTSEENVTTTHTITATTPNGETVNITLNITVRIITICYDWGCFTDQLNGTVTFTGSGIGGGYNYTGVNLTWMKCSQGQTWNATTNGCDGESLYYTNPNANNQCNNLVSHSYTDWRLPSISELKTLIHCNNKTLPTNGDVCGNENITPPALNRLFLDSSTTFSYWSSTFQADSRYWLVYFDISYVASFVFNGVFYVRCVRTGH